MKTSKAIAVAGMVAFGLGAAAAQSPASAQTVIDQWSSITAPAPALKDVKVNPKTTAFLVLDFVPKTCNAARTPRCIATLPKVKAFLAQARAHGMPVIYSKIMGAKRSDILKEVAPTASDPVVTAHADKFIGTDLEKLLKSRHVTTIIPVGTAAEGAVLYTASHAAFLGFKVIAPVDGASSPDPYGEKVTAWVLSHAPGVGTQTTLTSFDKISW